VGKLKIILMAAGAYYLYTLAGPFLPHDIRVPSTLPRSSAPAPTAPAPPAPATQPQRGADDDAAFVRTAVGNINREWSDMLGGRYRKPLLVMYSGQTTAPGCNTEDGMAHSQMGPFMCPQTGRIYLDPAFFGRVCNINSASCKFVAASIIAHEIGHSVQTQLGLGNGGPQFELQADCLSGVWAKHEDERLRKQGKPGLVEPGDVEAATRVLSSLAADRQRSHGTGAQRAAAFQKGWQGGTLASCTGGRGIV
jgi:predicted metalloprotease